MTELRSLVQEGLVLLLICYRSLAHPFAQQTSDGSASISFVSSSFLTTTAPTGVPTSCTYVTSAISYCNLISPGFSTFDPAVQALCLCYSSTNWIPDSFDGAVATCAASLFTANPALYSTITGLEGFCSSVGNIPGEPFTSPFSPTTSASASRPTSVPLSIQSSSPTAGASPISDLDPKERIGIGIGSAVVGIFIFGGFFAFWRKQQGKPLLRSSKAGRGTVRTMPGAPQHSNNAEKPWVSEVRSPVSDSNGEIAVQARI